MEDRNNLIILAIVGIVAIIGIIVMCISAEKTTDKPTYIVDDATGQAAQAYKPNCGPMAHWTNQWGCLLNEVTIYG